MDSKILAPVLAGIGIGWLAFSKEGQAMAKGLGQSIVPALAGGGSGDKGPEAKQLSEGEDKEKSESRKEDDD